LDYFTIERNIQYIVNLVLHREKKMRKWKIQGK